MGVNIEGFLNSLPLMGRGMFGIFAVTAVIILLVMLLNRLTSGDEKK